MGKRNTNKVYHNGALNFIRLLEEIDAPVNLKNAKAIYSFIDEFNSIPNRT